jgi:hypothetical protein
MAGIGLKQDREAFHAANRDPALDVVYGFDGRVAKNAHALKHATVFGATSHGE